MNEFDLDKESSSVEFDPSVRAREANPWEGETLEQSYNRRAIPLFLRPLFSKLPKAEAAYWIVFIVVCSTSMWMIMRFVKDFSDEQVSFQNSTTYHGKYAALYAELNAEDSGELLSAPSPKKP